MTNQRICFFLFIAIPAFIYHHRAITQAIIDFTNNWRGGPPTGPLPVNDARLLRRTLRVLTRAR